MTGSRALSALGSGLLVAFAASAVQANVEEMKPLTQEMIAEAVTYFREAPLDDVKQAFNDPTSDRWMGDAYHLHMMGMTAMLVATTVSAPALANLEEMETLTREMVLEAQEYFNSVPLEEAQQTFADPDGDRWFGDSYHLHMFGMDADGNIWADNIFTDLVGLNSLDMADFDGRLYNRDILAETEGNSDVYTLHIRFTNPESGAIVDTVGSCLRPVQEHVICSWANDS